MTKSKVQKNWYIHIRNISCVPFDIVKSLWLMVRSKARRSTKADVTVRTIIAGPLHLAPGGGGTLGISGWGCAAGTLEPLTYTRASSAEYCYPILE